MTTDMTENQTIEDSYLKFVSDENSLYNLKVLRNDNSNYKLVEKSIINTSSELAKIKYSNIKIERICRIHKKLPNNKTDSKSKQNILVFHGTPRNNVEGILNYGFKPSKG